MEEANQLPFDEPAGAEPLVSVFVLCYNHVRYVVDTLESVRHQTYKNVQLIIADDCSRDDSLAVIRNWLEEHAVSCQVIAHTENKGICGTLNDALSLTRGKYVSMVAGDDLWLSEKLERQVAILEASPKDVGAVYSDAWRADVNGTRLPEMFITSHRKFVNIPDGDIFEALIDGNFIPAFTPLIRMSCFGQVGLYDERLSYEDWDMWLRLAASFKFIFLPWPSGVYRVVPGSLVDHLFDKNDRGLTSNFMILEKLLAVGRVNAQLRQAVLSKICAVAEQLYRRRMAKRRSLLWKAWRLDRSARMALMCVMSFLNLPYAMFKRIDDLHATWARRSLA